MPHLHQKNEYKKNRLMQILNWFEEVSSKSKVQNHLISCLKALSKPKTDIQTMTKTKDSHNMMSFQACLIRP